MSGRGRDGAVSRWAVFDLNGTLLDPSGLGEGALERTVLAAMTLNHVGEYRPFPEVLARSGGRPGAPMPAYPEAAAALDLLAGAGVRLAVLTNSPTETAERGLRAAGLRERFEHVVGTDQVGVFKPDARVYRHGLAVIGAEPGDATMVAAHWWDLGRAGRGDAGGLGRARRGRPQRPPARPGRVGRRPARDRDDDRQRRASRGAGMRASVYHGPRDIRVEDVPDATLEGADRRPRARDPRVHLRQRPVALPRRARDLRAPRAAPATSSWGSSRRSGRT